MNLPEIVWKKPILATALALAPIGVAWGAEPTLHNDTRATWYLRALPSSTLTRSSILKMEVRVVYLDTVFEHKVDFTRKEQFRMEVPPGAKVRFQPSVYDGSLDCRAKLELFTELAGAPRSRDEDPGGLTVPATIRVNVKGVKPTGLAASRFSVSSLESDLGEVLLDEAAPEDEEPTSMHVAFDLDQETRYFLRQKQGEPSTWHLQQQDCCVIL